VNIRGCARSTQPASARGTGCTQMSDSLRSVLPDVEATSRALKSRQSVSDALRGMTSGMDESGVASPLSSGLHAAWQQRVTLGGGRGGRMGCVIDWYKTSASCLHLSLTFNVRHLARLLQARRAGAGAAVHDECGHLMPVLPCTSPDREENISAGRTRLCTLQSTAWRFDTLWPDDLFWPA